MKKQLIRLVALVCLSAACTFAQRPDGPDGPSPQSRMGGGPGSHIGRGMPLGPPGRWWTDPAIVQKLGLTADQQKKIDGIVEQSKLKLIDGSATLQKQEAIMEPLVRSDQPDETKILAQIDRVAQARAELEKVNARMLLGIRMTLNPEQWKKLQAEAPKPDHFMGGPGHQGGPGRFGPGSGNPGGPPQ